MNASIIYQQQSVEEVNQNAEQKESSRAARSSNRCSAGIRHNIGECIQLFIRETPLCERHQNKNAVIDPRYLLDYAELRTKGKGNRQSHLELVYTKTVDSVKRAR